MTTPVAAERAGAKGRKLAEVVARQIVRDIVDSGLEEGTMLPNERDMLQSLGVARPTLREALRLLENVGIITIKNGRGGGPVVRRPQPLEVGRLLSLVLQFQGMTVGAVLEARRQLEPMLVRLAAQNISDSQLDELRTIVNDMAQSTDDNPRFSDANRRFHSVIVAASGDVVLGIVEEALRGICPTLTGLLSVAQRKQALARHRKILRHLEHRDADKAEAASRAHIQHGIKYWHAQNQDLRHRAMQWID